MSNTDYLAWQFQGKNTSLQLATKTLNRNLQPDEILVKNQTIGINPVDWKLIQNNPQNWPVGHTPGVDGAGTVIKIGAQVPGNLLGKQVSYHQALALPGSFAEYTILKYNRVIKIPEHFPMPEAAATPCPMLTAILASEKIPVKANKRVLISGFGSVNKILTQILHKQGFSIDLLSASANQTQAEFLGITHIYRRVEALNSNYYAIFDATSPQRATELTQYLSANGHIVCIRGRVENHQFEPFTKTISYHEVALGALHHFGSDEDWQVLISKGEALLSDHLHNKLQLDSPVVFPFSDINQALTHSEKIRTKAVVAIT
ncbi:alcohol dehydrogenase catalytic domain-containing protein [Paraneptunicella aestuarii]|uniref:alcohol dehydrogenase catalytic domain-containing protein n=1 Tax=Paraneptunicella aestuarii TaxID=2831148 RepID=UPI001E504317|nr:alcohol dehydrogenase catalytic domain-containing protein [Paraneptunicella aestuarii]UAA37717.1 alcohol dehydrogenase catalytic domain-containing protein [Paraneptunicella aestuarii]